MEQGKDPYLLTLVVSSQLGAVASTIMGIEENIIEALGVIKIQGECMPSNRAVPVLNRLLKAALELINAHRDIISQFEPPNPFTIKGNDTIQ